MRSLATPLPLVQQELHYASPQQQPAARSPPVSSFPQAASARALWDSMRLSSGPPEAQQTAQQANETEQGIGTCCMHVAALTMYVCSSSWT
eukprot:6175607-Pleurochrysis_carterae.AAC.1